MLGNKCFRKMIYKNISFAGKHKFPTFTSYACNIWEMWETRAFAKWSTNAWSSLCKFTTSVTHPVYTGTSMPLQMPRAKESGLHRLRHFWTLRVKGWGKKKTWCSLRVFLMVGIICGQYGVNIGSLWFIDGFSWLLMFIYDYVWLFMVLTGYNLGL